jgi:hypothetical protein
VKRPKKYTRVNLVLDEAAVRHVRHIMGKMFQDIKIHERVSKGLAIRHALKVAAEAMGG